MEIDPISNGDELISKPTTTKLIDDPGENPSTLTESAISQMPSETKSDLTENITTLVKKVMMTRKLLWIFLRLTPINDHHQQQHVLQQQQDDIRPALSSSVSQELQQQ